MWCQGWQIRRIVKMKGAYFAGQSFTLPEATFHHLRMLIACFILTGPIEYPTDLTPVALKRIKSGSRKH